MLLILVLQRKYEYLIPVSGRNQDFSCKGFFLRDFPSKCVSSLIDDLPEVLVLHIQISCTIVYIWARYVW